MSLMSTRRTSLIGAMLATLGPISMSLYTPAMPTLVTAFGTTESAIKLTLSAYFAGFSIAQLAAGPLSDAYGRRKATIGFLIVYLVGSLMAALAPTVDLLILGRLIQGIGAAVGITVARAIVRDQYTGDEGAGIMNLIGIMLAVGPALGPSLGAIALAAFGWPSVFALMVAFGLVSLAVTLLSLRETTIPNPGLTRPGGVIRAYGALIIDSRFLTRALIMAGSVGALYAWATMLPFLLINEAGLTPSQFGASMLMQSGSYFLGSLALRQFMRHHTGAAAVAIGLAFIAIGALGMVATGHGLLPVGFLTVMAPVAVYAFGIAFVSPQVTTDAMQPFPAFAGSSSALLGFIQMGAGFAGGLTAAAIGEPLRAFGIVAPVLAVIAIGAWVWQGKCRRKAK
ncbi:multidrug effflux MFS transporter [Rhizobium sp. SG2393]|uniref:multidrug effflux MFS transporter n=1 Tax=Rhizobium sp. SG2393 TaxID=3276279 RepID=UPI003671910E